MLSALVRFCLELRLVVALLLLLIIGWGAMVAPFDWNLGTLPRDPVPVDAIPDIGENQQIIFTEWMGRSPQDVEDQVIPSPALSTSIEIRASSANAVSEMTAGVAAVVDVASPASTVSFVLKIDVPASLMSTVNVPVVQAELRDARTPLTVNAYGMRNLILFVPAAIAVVSSEQTTMIDSVMSVYNCATPAWIARRLSSSPVPMAVDPLGLLLDSVVDQLV